MAWFACPHLGQEVELTDERRGHIALRHPDSVEFVLQRLAATLREPEGVFRRAGNTRERLLHRSFEDEHRYRTVVAIIVADAGDERSWIVTAFVARRIAGLGTEWIPD